MGEKFSDIIEAGKNILSDRAKNSREGFFTKKTENSDGSGIEKYSLSDVANFMHQMKKLEDIETLEANSPDIYKPIRMVHAR